MNEIKLDTMGVPLTPRKIENNAVKTETASSQPEAVSVTNHMSKLVSLLSDNHSIPEESARVLDMKQRIQTGEYKVDMDKLSDTLLTSGVLAL